MDEEQKKLRTRLEAACAKREYCSNDVFQKAVRALNGDKEKAAEILSGLERDGFVNDVRYASAFAREKSALTGWGPVKIRFALSAKRISASDIDTALKDMDTEKAGERMRSVLSSKAKSLAGDSEAKLKLIRFALSRGYEYDAIKEVVNSVLK